MFQAFSVPHPQNVQIELSPAPIGGNLHRLLGLLIVAIRLAHRPELLVELKGPPLSVLLALALRADKKQSCFPSIDRLVKDTGYSRSSVCSALDRLEKAGLVERIRRQRQSTLYILQSFSLAAADRKRESQAEKSVTAKTRPTPSQEKRGKKAKRDVSGAGGSPAGKASDRKPGTSSPAQKEKPRQMDFDEWVEVDKKLVDAGIDRAVVSELIAHLRALGRSPHFVVAWLAAYRQGLAEHRIRGPGWLVSALRHDWELPKAYREMAMSDRERRMSYITGKFAEFIKY